MGRSIILPLVLTIFSILICSTGMVAQESDEGALAKATQNPLAAMYSLPFQNNTTFGNGPYNRAQNVLNIQPVIPFSITNKINLVNRIIIPVVTQPSQTENNSTTGLGDINYTAWFSPAKSSKITYGIGPAIQIPTASSDEFGSGEFGIGPSVVALIMLNKWVAGLVTNNIWSFGEAEESKFLFQYFVNYNLPKAWYIVSGPIMTANWNAPTGQKWIVPLGAGAGKVFKIAKQPINVNGQVFYNVEKPEGVGDIQSRIQIHLLFPKK